MKIEQNKMTNIQTHTHTQIVMMAKCVKKERKSKHQDEIILHRVVM